MNNSSADAAAMSEIVEAERLLYQAMIDKDFAAFEQILSPRLVYTHSTAVSETKDQYLAGVGNGLYEYESIATRDTRVTIRGQVAVINGVVDMRVSAEGQPKELIHLLFVLVWVKEGGKWQLELRQATRIPSLRS
jgi:hypothetical protein